MRRAARFDLGCEINEEGDALEVAWLYRRDLFGIAEIQKLGDFYRKKNLNEDAFWEYLRVDTLYSQNRNEHAKALYYLSKLFVDVKKDKVKSQEYLEKLKLLDGTEYAKKAATEK